MYVHIQIVAQVVLKNTIHKHQKDQKKLQRNEKREEDDSRA